MRQGKMRQAEAAKGWLVGALAPLALLALLAAGCTFGRRPSPDIRRLYQAVAGNQDRNPVVVIPGLMGSRLETPEGRVAWGAFTKEAVDLSSPEGLRIIAPDLWEEGEGFDHRRVPELGGDVRASGPLDRLELGTVFGVFPVRIYASILGVLGVGGYVDETFAPLDYPEEHFNCFTFFYDWRLDVVANARALGEFLRETRPRVAEGRRKLGLPPEPVKFDVVAHSLGGLVARYYLRYGDADILGDPAAEVTWAGAAEIDRLILVAPPNLGAMEALQNLVTGWKKGPAILKFPSFDPALIAALPSAYQMLPREWQKPFVDAAGEEREVAFLHLETWLENDWGPFRPDQDEVLRVLFPREGSPAARRRRAATFVGAFLERARHLFAALDRRPSSAPPAEIYLFAGDAEPTLDRARVVEVAGRLEISFERPEAGLTALGDGTVTRASALADLRRREPGSLWLVSSVPWTASVFVGATHLGLTRQRSFQDNVLHVLLERRPRAMAPPV